MSERVIVRPVEEETFEVGRSVQRIDGLGKVTGKTTFASDLTLPRMLHGKYLRSPLPHARIARLDTSAAQSLKGVRAVMTAKDVPGRNRYGLAILDQPVLADDRVRYIGDPVALVAAEEEEIAEEALERIVVEYQALPAVFSPEEALKEGAPQIHESGNLVLHFKIRKGDVETGFGQADVIVENTYKTHRVYHAYLETEAGIADMDSQGNLTLWSGTQYPIRTRRQVAQALGIPENTVRIIQPPMGGGFGGKDDLTVEIGIALLALKTGRPVKMVWSRQESMEAHTKRVPMTIRYKSGAKRDGRLSAIEVTIHGDLGPYASIAHFVVKKAVVPCTGPYHIPHVKADGYAVYTNNSRSGAIRGFGAVQAAVAYESQMDILAEKLGMSPLEIRRINALDVGLSTGTGQVLKHSVGIKATLERLSRYVEEKGIRL
jgi:CO/xanthine dehydrogenase Mo-binding subunit